MGHVYYANYLVWFEIGRIELLRSLGQRYRDWEDVHGIFLPVASCRIDYRRPAHFDDVVRIHARIAQVTKASIAFEYELYLDPGEQLLAQGETRHAFVTAGGKIARVADKLLPQLFEPGGAAGAERTPKSR